MLRPFLVAVAFLTRVPVPVGAVEARDLARALGFFPAVGLLLGAFVAGLGWLLDGRVGDPLTALALVAALALLTGALHLDGVADLFDGLGARGGGRERMLEVMRDSRLGTFGGLALLFVVLGKVATTQAALARADWMALAAAPALGRAAAVPLSICFPYARPEGTGRAFGGAGGRELAIAGLTALAVLACVGARGVLPLLVAAVAVAALAFAMNRRLGGLTGDVCGAAVEIAEVLFLAALA